MSTIHRFILSLASGLVLLLILSGALNAQGTPGAALKGVYDSGFVKTLLPEKVETVYVFSFPSNAVAITRCMDNEIGSWMDMKYLDDPKFAEEVIAHERKHREQFAEMNMSCANWESAISDIKLAISHESEAFCASLNVVRKQGGNVREKWQEYLEIMGNQFAGAGVDTPTLVKALNYYCPLTQSE